MDFVDDYKNGLTIREIAVKHGFSYETVRKSLINSKVNWNRKYVSEFSKEDVNKVVEMFDANESVKEIAKLFKISPPAISRLLKANNREPVCSSRKYDILRQTPINFIQKQFIVGHLLGDGWAYRDGPDSMYKIGIGQKIAHAQYFHWKVAMMDPFVNGFYETYNEKKNSRMLQTSTICHHGFKFFADLFYDSQRIKHVPDGLEMYMTPLALATWVMDDGSLNGGVNQRIATHSFTQEENYKLRNLICSVFDIRSKVMEFRYKGKLYYNLTINKENTKKLSDIVRPHIVDCMKYKLMTESSTTICRTSNNEG